MNTRLNKLENTQVKAVKCRVHWHYMVYYSMKLEHRTNQGEFYGINAF